MAKRKTAREIILGFMDAVMEKTAPQHEALLDAGSCAPERPCPYCRQQEAMLEALKDLG